MNSKDYVREILDQLMKKYQNRAPRRWRPRETMP